MQIKDLINFCKTLEGSSVRDRTCEFAQVRLSGSQFELLSYLDVSVENQDYGDEGAMVCTNSIKILKSWIEKPENIPWQLNDEAGYGVIISDCESNG